ncbi:MAG: hypothetical protein KC910_38875, partial [Candidatus Eremiobacteraeota bacterium]|nr:hypothetical protein [Candidatus Eremiobacteraeota bacterium]
DIYFYDMLFRNGGNGDEITRLQNTVDKLNRAVPGMIDSLSLSIVVRLPNGRYRNIIQHEIYSD